MKRGILSSLWPILSLVWMFIAAAAALYATALDAVAEKIVGGGTYASSEEHWANVRLYDDPEKPAEYTIFSAPVHGERVLVDMSELGEAAVLAVVASDQTDADVAARLEHAISVWHRREASPPGDSDVLARLGLPSEEGAPSKRVLVHDAEYVPLAGGTVTLVLAGLSPTGTTQREVHLATWTLDDKGAFTCPHVQGHPSLQRRLRIAHPDYGTAEVELPHAGALVNVPLVRAASPLCGRALKGAVKGEDGSPVAGARIDATAIRTLGEGLIQTNGQQTVFTDAAGAFRYYPALHGDVVYHGPPVFYYADTVTHGRAVPPKSRYSFSVTPPNGSPWFAASAVSEAGKDALVLLGKLGPTRLHAFAFQDETGPIESAEMLRRVSLVLYPPGSTDDANGLCLSAEAAVNGISIPRGRIEATFSRITTGAHEPDTVRFQPIEVTEDSPRQLAFYLPPPPVYAGHVVDATTGRPLWGAFVVSHEFDGQGSLANLTAPEWQAVHKLALQPDIAAAALDPVRNCFGFTAVTRTESDGSFRLSGRRGSDIYSILAFDENYIPSAYRPAGPRAEEDTDSGELSLRLFPAASVSVTIHSDAGFINIYPKWNLEDSHLPEWAEPLDKPTCCGSDIQLKYTSWLRPNELGTFYVPANLDLSLRFECPYHAARPSVELDDIFHLAAGERLDLGTVDIGDVQLRAVTITLRDAAGGVYEGIPVRRALSRRDGGVALGVAHNTDENGRVFFRVPEDFAGRFVVSRHDMGMPSDSDSRYAAELEADLTVAEDTKYEMTIPKEVVEVVTAP